MGERKEQRHALELGAQFRVRTGRRDVLLTDLSRHGCRIVAPGLHLPVGQNILLRPKSLESLAATVRWWENGAGGVEFDLPLHPAVVDHLCRLHPARISIARACSAAEARSPANGNGVAFRNGIFRFNKQAMR
ncbi:PilZ domain-containing protein [Sphingomonas sp. CL5.1]|uniref:PilZ domain-containing protein n=1 Tax=Sphingomonas sp. CL5.1 TaxID=2653203 RepID=UPI0015815B7F|nr:PilZ domain-containing protein [Sphingomonas sp. CL5.1]QKR99770.1 PilZ domain-containing protein [Sphingomonas sp. CL5.1]